MSTYEELSTLSTRIACDVTLAKEPERDLLVHEALGSLSDQESFQVLGYVIAQLCELIDEIYAHVPGLQNAMEAYMRDVRGKLPQSPGEGRGKEA